MVSDKDKINADEILKMLKDLDTETLRVVYQFVKVLRNKQNN